VHIIIAKVPC